MASSSAACTGSGYSANYTITLYSTTTYDSVGRKGTVSIYAVLSSNRTSYTGFNTNKVNITLYVNGQSIGSNAFTQGGKTMETM